MNQIVNDVKINTSLDLFINSFNLMINKLNQNSSDDALLLNKKLIKMMKNKKFDADINTKQILNFLYNNLIILTSQID